MTWSASLTPLNPVLSYVDKLNLQSPVGLKSRIGKQFKTRVITSVATFALGFVTFIYHAGSFLLKAPIALAKYSFFLLIPVRINGKWTVLSTAIPSIFGAKEMGKHLLKATGFIAVTLFGPWLGAASPRLCIFVLTKLHLVHLKKLPRDANPVVDGGEQPQGDPVFLPRENFVTPEYLQDKNVRNAILAKYRPINDSSCSENVDDDWSSSPDSESPGINDREEQQEPDASLSPNINVLLENELSVFEGQNTDPSDSVVEKMPAETTVPKEEIDVGIECRSPAPVLDLARRFGIVGSPKTHHFQKQQGYGNNESTKPLKLTNVVNDDSVHVGFEQPSKEDHFNATVDTSQILKQRKEIQRQIVKANLQ